MSIVKSIPSIHHGKLQTGTFLAGWNTISAIGAVEEMKVATRGGVSLLLKLYLSISTWFHGDALGSIWVSLLTKTGHKLKRNLCVRGNKITWWVFFPPVITVVSEMDLMTCGISHLNIKTLAQPPDQRRAAFLIRILRLVPAQFKSCQRDGHFQLFSEVYVIYLSDV